MSIGNARKFDINLPERQTDTNELAKLAIFSELSERDLLFVVHYLKSFDAKQAVIDAGIAHSNSAAKFFVRDVMARPAVKRALSQYFASFVAGIDETLSRISDIARDGDVSHFIDVDEDGRVSLNLSSERAKANMGLVKKVSQTETRRVDKEGAETITTKLSIEVYSKLDALSILAKHYDGNALPGDEETKPSAPLYITVDAGPVRVMKEEQEQEQGQDEQDQL